MSLPNRFGIRSLCWALLLPAALVLTACSTGATSANPASFPSVSVDDGTAYVAAGPAVYAVDIESGEVKWKYPDEASSDVSFYAAPAIAEDGLIYLGSYDKIVRAVDAATGNEIREFEALDGRVIGSPVVAGDLLLVPTDGGSLYAYERHSGQQKWKFTSVGDACGPEPNTPPCSFWSAPLVDGETVYIASLAHLLYAIDLASGEERWDAPVELDAAIADTPALEDGLLLTGVLGNSLVGVRAQDGAEMWTAPTSGWLWGSPVVADSMAYFGDATPTWWTTKDGVGNVYAFDLASRTVIWQTPTAATSTSPLIVDERLIVAFENGQLIAYDLAGNELWHKAAFGPILADPVVADGKVIVAVTSKEALLQAFDSATGASAWDYLPDENG
jgi:outer membrane protein assembly factor BamB